MCDVLFGSIKSNIFSVFSQKIHTDVFYLFILLIISLVAFVVYMSYQILFYTFFCITDWSIK